MKVMHGINMDNRNKTMSTFGDAADVNPVIKFLPHTANHVVQGLSTCPLCHVIYHSCDKGSWRQSLLSTARHSNVCGRNLITGLTSAASPRVDMVLFHRNTTEAYNHQRPTMATCFGLLPTVHSTGKCWPEDSLEKTGICSRTGVLIIVCFVVLRRNKSHFTLKPIS
jgi:hypothetical protein